MWKGWCTDTKKAGGIQCTLPVTNREGKELGVWR